MMKKTYMTPEMALYKLELQQMLAASGNILDGVTTETSGFEELGREFDFDVDLETDNFAAEEFDDEL